MRFALVGVEDETPACVESSAGVEVGNDGLVEAHSTWVLSSGDRLSLRAVRGVAPAEAAREAARAWAARVGEHADLKAALRGAIADEATISPSEGWLRVDDRDHPTVLAQSSRAYVRAADVDGTVLVVTHGVSLGLPRVQIESREPDLGK